MYGFLTEEQKNEYSENKDKRFRPSVCLKDYFQKNIFPARECQKFEN
jgi:hypothetical protein